MEVSKKGMKKKKSVLTAGIYIGVVGTLIKEDKEKLISEQIGRFMDFANENGISILATYIDRDNLGIERCKFDSDFAAKKFQNRFMFIEY